MYSRSSDLAGDVLIEPQLLADDAQGTCFESFNARRFAMLTGVSAPLVQDNHSKSAGGVLRGLRYQIGQAQGKLVGVVVGEVSNVCVDLRRSSPTSGRWKGVTLSAANKCRMWIPAGLAHGFLAISDGAEMLYKTSEYRAPQHERCLLWSDRAVGIDWPLDSPPVLSARDTAGKPGETPTCFPETYGLNTGLQCAMPSRLTTLRKVSIMIFKSIEND